jgi:ribosome-binding factor A
MKMDTPKTLNFIDNPKMKHFNVIFKENLSLVIFGSRIKAVVVSSNVKFTKVRVTPAFTDVFIYWTMTTSLEDEASSIDRVQRDLDAAAPDIRHDMAQLKVLGKMPKIMFVKDTDVAATADELLDKLATFRQLAPPTDQPSEAYSATQEAELKTNILRFNRQRTMDEVLIKVCFYSQLW